jgi:hypothetical protein
MKISDIKLNSIRILSKTAVRVMLASIVILFSGCDNFVDVELPASQLTGDIVFEDKATATAAMVDIYSKMRDNGIFSGTAGGVTVNLSLYSDELSYYGAAGDAPAFFHLNSLQASTSTIGTIWNSSYSQIYAANAVIKGVQSSTALIQGDRDQLLGEALFVRGLLHFYLVNLYGDIPYIATTDYEANRLAPRNSVTQVYEKITADLSQAISLLPEQYATAERVRPNKSAAWALLARTLLYNGDWAGASDAASAVINNTAYGPPAAPSGAFLKDADTTIWQFYPSSPGTNSDFGRTFIFLEGPPGFVSLNELLVNSFEAGDLRKEQWVKAVSDGSSTWYHPYKYTQNDFTGTSLEYTVVLRIAEQYLIRAEARARLAELVGAKEDLDRIRNAAGLTDSQAQTQQEIIAAVLKERRAELFTEFGHRFFDLKRTGLLDMVLATSKPGWDTTDVLWPLPETELLADPNLAPQNPGY